MSSCSQNIVNLLSICGNLTKKVTKWEINKTEVENEIEIFITLAKYNTYQQRKVGKPLLVVTTLYIFPICHSSHRPDECGTKPFLRWVRTQCRSPDTPSGSKKYLGPSRHSLKKRCLRRQVINLNPRGGLEPGETAPWGLRRTSRMTWMLSFPNTQVGQLRYFHPLTIVSNVSKRNGTNPLMFIGRV